MTYIFPFVPSIVADAEGIILRNEQAISPVNPDGNVKFAFALHI